MCKKETILLDNNNSFISSHLPKTEITLVFEIVGFIPIFSHVIDIRFIKAHNLTKCNQYTEYKST